MKESLSYRDAGVDTTEGIRAVSLMKKHLGRTFGPETLSGIGGFGGLYKPDLSGLKAPVLVSGCDGVGTKLRIAAMMDRHDTVGIDLVAMCANDVLCQGARPMFFLDYIAAGRIVAEKIAAIVEGIAEGCVRAGCALIGGETAEMPGFYADDDYDVAGFAVGLVDEDKIVDGSNIAAGDVIIGLPSSGVHSNGFSLVRKIFFEQAGLGADSLIDGLDGPLGEVLLTPTRVYQKPVAAMLPKFTVKGMAHITGGGFYENIPRIIPEGLGVEIDRSAWEPPAVFRIIEEYGAVSKREMFSTFNMGIGFIIILPEEEADEAIGFLGRLDENARITGRVTEGAGVMISGLEEK